MHTQQVDYDWRNIETEIKNFDHFDERFITECFRKATMEYGHNKTTNILFRKDGADFVMLNETGKELDRMENFPYNHSFTIVFSEKDELLSAKGMII